MCGMAGWVSYEGNLRTQRDVIAAMTETMACRGPDAGGMFIDRHVGVGHRRLAVIDLAGGVQPMEVEEADHAIVSLILHRRGLQLHGAARPAEAARPSLQDFQ